MHEQDELVAANHELEQAGLCRMEGQRSEVEAALLHLDGDLPRRHAPDIGHEPVVAHNDPSPARERVLRLFEEHHIPLRMVISLPSLDGIKRAVEMKLGVALLPRRCAITEIASGRLVAIPVAGVSRKRQVMLVCRKAHRSHAADAFLSVAQEKKAGSERSTNLERR